MNNEKTILYKITQKNFGEKTKDDWNSMLWTIYEDLSVKYKIHFGTGKIEEYDFSLTEKEIEEINKSIESIKESDINQVAFDGTVWQFTKFENNSVVWESKLGYIYGIKPLEDIEDILNDKTEEAIKYSIDEKENVPQFAYGIPDSMRKDWYNEAKIEEKYNIDSKDNYPVEVYGIPKPLDVNENKYEIKPEENIPQKVYGIPNAMPKKEEKVMPPIEDKIIVKVKNSDKDYELIVKVDKTLVGAFLYAGEANKIPTKDDYIGISTVSYYTFYRDLKRLLNDVDNNYTGSRDITWSIEINRFGDEPEIYQGKGEVPTNWNLLMDLFAKMDINYKK